MCGHADVIKALLDPRVSSNRPRVGQHAKTAAGDAEPAAALGEHIANWLGFMDPPRHTEIRKSVARVFTPKLAQTWRTRVRALADDLAGRMTGPRVTWWPDLAHPLPLTVICDILGIPPRGSRPLLAGGDQYLGLRRRGRARRGGRGRPRA